MTNFYFSADRKRLKVVFRSFLKGNTMCQKSPGARCAKHTRESLDRLRVKINNLMDQSKKMETELEAKLQSGKEPTFTEQNQWLAVRERLQHNREKFKTTQRQFDATKTGQKELAAKIKESTGEARQRLIDRKKAGILLHSWHAAAVDRKHSEDKRKEALAA